MRPLISFIDIMASKLGAPRRAVNGAYPFRPPQGEGGGSGAGSSREARTEGRVTVASFRYFD